MIKAARIWGGASSQGKAFGFLDGGRGLVGAIIGSLGVLIFSIFIGSEIANTKLTDTQEAFKYVILVASAIVFLVGVLVWFFLKLNSEIENTQSVERISTAQIKEVLRLPSVSLLMVIILCAYVGYKTTDVFSLYAQDVMLYDQVKSAQVGTFLLFIRPIIGVVIGFLADKSQTTLWLFISFVISCSGAVLFASGLIVSSTFLFFVSTLIVATGVYAARCLYFAVMQRGRIPLVLTGTAVGMISIIGYTPDIFAGPLMGYLLDNSPGVEGHQDVFWMLASFSFIGGLASFFYYRIYNKDLDISNN